MTHLGDRIFNRVDHELAEEFINDRDLFMKYTSAMRQVRHIPPSTRAYDCCDVFFSPDSDSYRGSYFQ